jgi:hypothetical protein
MIVSAKRSSALACGAPTNAAPKIRTEITELILFVNSMPSVSASSIHYFATFSIMSL